MGNSKKVYRCTNCNRVQEVSNFMGLPDLCRYCGSGKFIDLNNKEKKNGKDWSSSEGKTSD